jgi:type II secretory pathway component PulM
MSLRTSLIGLVQRPGAYFSREWNRLAPRERGLVAVLGGAVVAAIVAVLALLTAQSLAEIREDNAAARAALAAIAQHRDEFLDAKSRMQAQETRIGLEAPQLAADLEAAAREVGIQIPETSSKPAVPAGRRYLEHSVLVTLRQVDLLSLTKFLSKVETGQRVIVISKLSIKQAFGEGEKLNVSLTATAWERVNDARKKPGVKEKT